MAKKKKEEVVEEGTNVEEVDSAQDPSSVLEQVENPGEFFAGLAMKTTVSLKNPGTGIRGILRGESDPVEIMDHDEMRKVRTWSIETASGMVVRLMGSTVLDRELENLEPPQKIAIVRGPDKMSGKRRIGMYQVAAAPHTD